jgi:chromosome segregation ATPase
MNNEKYVNYYIETLTSTLTDTLLRNISLQVSSRIGEESVNELTKVVEEFQNSKQQIDSNHVDQLNEKNDYIRKLEDEIQQLRNMKGEFENTRHQVQHVDTFRSELSKEREEHEKTRQHYEQQITELNSKIDYLQLTPAKRKKIDDINKVINTVETLALPLEETKDGGVF